jgi:hypothetical protein
VTSEAVAVANTPGGEKAQGRIGLGRRFGGEPATDFRGDQGPGGERGAVKSSVAGPFEPTPGGQGWPRGRAYAAEGETFGEFNPKSVTGMKQGRKVAGGRRRQEGEKP